MNHIEELYYIVELLHKHNLPLSPILEYAIKEREEQYVNEEPEMVHARDKEHEPEVCKKLEDYIGEFENMSVGVSKGKKLPHKAILLLSLMNMIEAGIISDNRIDLDNAITYAFAYTWNTYYDTKVPTVWTPFYHLKSEPFWHFKANHNEEKMNDLFSFGGTPSIGKMRLVIKYAYLDKTLFDYMENTEYRNKLKEVLINNYIK